MKKYLLTILALISLCGCSNFTSQDDEEQIEVMETGTSIDVSEDGKVSAYTDSTAARATAVISDDLFKTFVENGIDACVYINFDETTVTASLDNQDTQVTITNEETSLGKILDKKITATLSSNTLEDEAAGIDEASNGVIIQYKGSGKIKYILSGNYNGTVFIKNKDADSAVVLNNVNISSDNGAGPVLRFSSQKRTFIVVQDGTTNTLTDTRILNQADTMYDDKKGSIYSKGAIIFTGETNGGTLNIINSGYKHAVYSKDYIRIADGITLNISVEGTTGRDCLRALNAVIIDGGTINLSGKGTTEDDESVGIKVEGEDADEDEKTVEYSAGTGFVVINGGNLTINTVAKGITAHWKKAKSVIEDSSYTATINQSLLCQTYLKDTTALTPDPFVEINGGIINITTTGKPYEGRTDEDPSCSPEGIEAKSSLTINAGTITLNCTDDAINAGGDIVINGGAVYAYSSQNDAIDSNGTNGITINGGVIVALGTNVPECAFDCDQNPFTINGGIVVGLGSSNYTLPKDGTQNVIVLGSSNCGDTNTTLAILDSTGTPAFAYTLPSSTGDILIISSPEIKAGTSYTLKKNVSVSGGTAFHNLYTTLPDITGGTTILSDFTPTEANKVYKDSTAGSGFGGAGGGGGFGGPGGFSGGPGNNRNPRQ